MYGGWGWGGSVCVVGGWKWGGGVEGWGGGG